MNAPLIGARIQRREDYPCLAGAGQYTDDVLLPPATAQTVWRSLQTKAA